MGSRSVRPSLAHNRVIWVPGNIWLWPLGPGAVGSGAGLVVGAQRRGARAGPKQLPPYGSWGGGPTVIPPQGKPGEARVGGRGPSPPPRPRGEKVMACDRAPAAG